MIDQPAADERHRQPHDETNRQAGEQSRPRRLDAAPAILCPEKLSHHRAGEVDGHDRKTGKPEIKDARHRRRRQLQRRIPSQKNTVGDLHGRERCAHQDQRISNMPDFPVASGRGEFAAGDPAQRITANGGDGG
ncbi:hypothetical protein SDC9_74417 [bioreactor metagenome]|uniref:Uncharacterized protein n=1 Tax=bioreactor metagenome TaxID=1076179 RepID=A0A644YH09_9ZZZZ